VRSGNPIATKNPPITAPVARNIPAACHGWSCRYL
jgi:hypothetical protein